MQGASLDRAFGHGRLVFLYALGLVLGALPWVLEAAGLPRPESRRFLYERFVRVEWVLSGALIPFVAAKLMRAQPVGHPLRKLGRVVAFAAELLLISAPLSALLHDMGAGTAREWMASRLELLAFLSVVAAISVLSQLVLKSSLAALGASYVAAAGFLAVGGGAGLSLALGSAALAGVAARGHRSLRHEE